MRAAIAMVMMLAAVLAQAAERKPFDPKTATPKEKATVGAAFLLVAARECAKHKSDPAVLETAIPKARKILTDGGYGANEAEQFIQTAVEAPETEADPKAGPVACGLMQRSK